MTCPNCQSNMSEWDGECTRCDHHESLTDECMCGYCRGGGPDYEHKQENEEYCDEDD